MSQHIYALPARVPTRVDERAALKAEIADLDARLERPTPAGRPGGARIMSVAELRAERDRLAHALAVEHGTEQALADARARARAKLEAMYAHPAAHKLAVVTREQLGESGCGTYAVRPRMGPIGLMTGWWRVKVSSGCPLATARRSRRAPAGPPRPAARVRHVTEGRARRP